MLRRSTPFYLSPWNLVLLQLLVQFSFVNHSVATLPIPSSKSETTLTESPVDTKVTSLASDDSALLDISLELALEKSERAQKEIHKAGLSPTSCEPVASSTLHTRELRAHPFEMAYLQIKKQIDSKQCDPNKTLLLFDGENVLFNSGSSEHLPPHEALKGKSKARIGALSFLRKIQDLKVNTIMTSHESPVLKRGDWTYYPDDTIAAWRKGLPQSLRYATHEVKNEDDLYSKVLALSLIYKKEIYLFGRDYILNFLTPNEVKWFHDFDRNSQTFDPIFSMEYAGVLEDLKMLPDGSTWDEKSRQWTEPKTHLGNEPAAPSKFFDPTGNPSHKGFFLYQDEDLAYSDATHTYRGLERLGMSRLTGSKPAEISMSFENLKELEGRGLLYFDHHVLMTSGIDTHLALSKLLSNLGTEHSPECVFNISSQENSLKTLEGAHKIYPHLKFSNHIQTL